MLPFAPKIPAEPVAIYLEGLVALQAKAAFWTRLATAVTVVSGAVFLGLALYGRVPWLIALPFFLAPMVPIAAETRVSEIRRVIDEQLRDRLAERSREQVEDHTHAD